jgi:hypothetical protein
LSRILTPWGIVLEGYRLKCCTPKEDTKINISGRKFAEHTDLEDAEKIDNDPLYSISAERIKRLLYRNPSIVALLVKPFSLTILIRDV